MHHPTPERCQFLQAGAVTAASLALPALAQSFPAKPIKLICPWPAGGSSDMIMRALAESARRADPNPNEECWESVRLNPCERAQHRSEAGKCQARTNNIK